MTRVLSSACLVLLLLGWSGSARAGGKPAIAILGLEVNDNGSGIDPETTKAAKELTAALRERAKVVTGPYAWIQGGDKELIDEKLLNNCDSEAPACMAAIGSELGAEVLMYGNISKSAQNGQTVYKVSIKLLNVGRKQLANSVVETLPASESSGVKVLTHAKTWYAKLAGINTGGSVVVRANIDRGSVLVDDEWKGNLASGTLTLSGIGEGRHTLAIEAKDYQRYETSITVKNGETLPHSATLTEMSKKAVAPGPPVRSDPVSIEGTVSSKSGFNVWKPIFYGSTILEAGAIGFALYELKLSRDDAKRIQVPGLDESKCTAANEAMDPAFKSACSHYTKRTIGWVVSGVMGAAMIGSFFMAFVHDSGDTDSKTMANGRRKRRQLAVTPVVSPDGGGATLRFDW
jgi:hypothetical protein